MSPKIEEAFYAGKMKNMDILLMFSLGSELKRHENQDKIIEEFEKGNITSKDLIGEKAGELMERLEIRKLKRPELDSTHFFTRVLLNVISAAEILKEHGDDIKELKGKGLLISKFDRLIEEVEKLR